MSTIPVWQPETTYSPGAQVIRATVPSVIVEPPANASFDEGDVSWTKEAAEGGYATWVIETHANAFDGAYSARLSKSGPGETYKRLYATTPVPAKPNQTITASCMVQQGGASAGNAGAKVQLEWLDESLVSLRVDDGNLVKKGSDGVWKQSTVTATAPGGTAFVRIGASGYQKESGKRVSVDKFLWDYSYRSTYVTFVYTAVQDGDGISAATEPVWPEDPDSQVVDGTVIWQTQYGSSVTWEAVPILKSGLTEPDWPLEPGGSIVDGSIVWTAASRRVKDTRCPNSTVVAIAASKIFAGDDDIIPYSATTNPLDWSTPDDAGYLPFGLQTHGANPVSAMGLYRGNLVAFNSAGFQMWQVDQDPQNMALLDAAPVGSTEARGVQPLQNDLVFLNSVGIRNISIAGASTNLQAGSTGEPIDPLVTPKMRARLYDPISAFIPAYGQYWCIFGDEAFVLTLNEGKTGKWSRYVFPEVITDTTLLDNDLYVRTATHKVWRVSEEFLVDDYYLGIGVDFEGVVHWPHMDFGSIGVEKQFVGFDLVAEAPEGVTISVGYDQRDVDARTAAYTMDADSLPGRLVPIPVAGPSFDFKLTFAANQEWEWFASILYVQDMRQGT